MICFRPFQEVRNWVQLFWFGALWSQVNDMPQERVKWCASSSRVMRLSASGVLRRPRNSRSRPLIRTNSGQLGMPSPPQPLLFPQQTGSWHTDTLSQTRLSQCPTVQKLEEKPEYSTKLGHNMGIKDGRSGLEGSLSSDHWSISQWTKTSCITRYRSHQNNWSSLFMLKAYVTGGLERHRTKDIVDLVLTFRALMAPLWWHILWLEEFFFWKLNLF